MKITIDRFRSIDFVREKNFRKVNAVNLLINQEIIRKERYRYWMELFSYSVFLLDRRVKRVYSRDGTTLENLFLASFSPTFLSGRAQNASLPGLKPGVCKPERRGRVKVTVYFPPLAAIPEEQQGSGKNEVSASALLSNFLRSCYKRWSKREGNVIRTGICFVTRCCCVWLSCFQEINFY